MHGVKKVDKSPTIETLLFCLELGDNGSYYKKERGAGNGERGAGNDHEERENEKWKQNPSLEP